MADQSDVSQTIVATITGVLFPGALPTQLSVSPVIGAMVRIYPGWPVSNSLNTDLAASVVNVSVFPTQVSRNATRYLLQPVVTFAPNPTLTATVAGSTVTFGGTGGAGQVVGVKIGQTPATTVAQVYRVTANDTPTTVAANLAALFPSGGFGPGVSGVTASGPVLALATNYPVSVVLEADATTATEYRRIEQRFMVSIWSPTPQLRDVTCAAIDNALAQITFLTLPDNSAGHLRWAASPISDAAENDGIYRRDLVYSVEYPTNQITVSPRVIVGIETITANGGPAIDMLTHQALVNTLIS